MSWGEIYNTSWWGVALDTARTVKARPDFFGSQLNLLTSEQPNLLTNGTFDTNSDWTLGTGWSISGGKASCDGSQVSGTQLYQTPITFTNSKTYKVVFTCTIESGNLDARLQGSGATVTGDAVTTSGTYTQYLVSTGNISFRMRGNTDFIGSIDNVSVQLVRAELDQIEAKKCLADWIHTTALKDLNN
jgi:hypothetical protein